MADFPENPAQQLAGAWQVAVSVFGQWREQVSAATIEAKEKLDPAFHSAVEAVRAAFHGNWGACRCACATAHPQDRGVCDHNAVLMRHVGDKDVPLCAPCAVAQGVAEMRR